MAIWQFGNYGVYNYLNNGKWRSNINYYYDGSLNMNVYAYNGSGFVIADTLYYGDTSNIREVRNSSGSYNNYTYNSNNQLVSAVGYGCPNLAVATTNCYFFYRSEYSYNAQGNVDSVKSFVLNKKNQLVPSFLAVYNYNSTIASIYKIEQARTDIQLYPNPSAGIFHLSNSSGLLVSIYNATGVLIKKKYTSDILDLSDQSDGVYFVQLNSTLESKFVKIAVIK